MGMAITPETKRSLDADRSGIGAVEKSDAQKGFRIRKLTDLREIDRALTTHLASYAWKLMPQLAKNEIELFKATNSLDNVLAIMVGNVKSRTIDLMHPIKGGLTTAKAVRLLDAAIAAANYQVSGKLLPLVIDADGNSWPLGELPETLVMAKDWTIMQAGTIDLPRILHAEGSVVISGTRVHRGAVEIKVKGNFDVSMSGLHIIPANTHIEQDLIATESELETICAGAYIGGKAKLNGSKINKLSAAVFIGKDIDVGNTPLREVEPGVTVNGDLMAENIPAEDLGRGLHVKGKFVLTGSKLKTLPEDSIFEGDIYTDNRALIIPPSATVMGRILVLGTIGFEIVPIEDMSRA